MRTLALLMVVLGGGCLESRQPYSAPAAPANTPATDDPVALEIRQRIDLGGKALDVVGDGDAVYVATTTGVDIFPGGSFVPTERIVTPGIPVELLLDDGVLWIAAERGGLLRVERAMTPDERAITHWETPGPVRGLARQDRWLWAGLEDGRLLVLPADASTDAAFGITAVDGWPDDLAPWGDGVLVAARGGGLRAARVGTDGEPEVIPPPIDHGYVTTVLPVGDDLYYNTFKGLVRESVTDGSRVEATQRARDVARFGQGVLAAVGKEGILEWDGNTAEVAAVPLILPNVDSPVVVRALAVLDEDLAVVAADEMGVFWLRKGSGGWEIEARHRYLGRCDALEWVDGRLAAGLTGPENATMVLLDHDDGGSWRVAEQVEVAHDIGGMVQVGRELLVAGVGVHVIDLDHLDGGAVDTGLVDGPIEGLELLPSGQVVGLQKEQCVIWLERTATGDWAVHARSPNGFEFIPMNITSLGDRVGVGYGGYGRLKIYDRPGEPATANVLLAGGAVHRDGPFMRPSGSAAASGRFWVSIPHVGVDGVDPDTLETTLLRVRPGVADVHAAGDLLAAALGKGGLALLDPTSPENPVVARIALPGDARAVLASEDELVVASGGTLFVVSATAPVPGSD